MAKIFMVVNGQLEKAMAVGKFERPEAAYSSWVIVSPEGGKTEDGRSGRPKKGLTDPSLIFKFNLLINLL